jgi:membrane complex biogenesis BtpA family protein
MISNETSLPYQTEVGPETIASMSFIIGQLHQDIRVPFGVNVLWDPAASIALAKACGAKFVREVFTGVYGSDMGLWNTNVGKVYRYRRSIAAQDVRLLFNIFPEFAASLGERSLDRIARTVTFSSLPDALCISGATAGIEVETDLLSLVKDLNLGIPVFANTGVNIENVREMLGIADGAIVGTYFKEDGCIWNQVDQERVVSFMEIVNKIQ